MSEKRQCAKRLGRSRLCNSPAVKEECGKWWCWAHAPSTRAQREKIAATRWETEEAKRQRGYALHDACAEIVAQAKLARASKLLPRKLAAAVDTLLALESEGA